MNIHLTVHFDSAWISYGHNWLRILLSFIQFKYNFFLPHSFLNWKSIWFIHCNFDPFEYFDCLTIINSIFNLCWNICCYFSMHILKINMSDHHIHFDWSINRLLVLDLETNIFQQWFLYVNIYFIFQLFCGQLNNHNYLYWFLVYSNFIYPKYILIL